MLPSALDCFEQSPEATMDAQTIREKIRALKLDKSWNTTLTKFINHYQSLVILLESISRPYFIVARKAQDDHASISSTEQQGYGFYHESKTPRRREGTCSHDVQPIFSAAKEQSA